MGGGHRAGCGQRRDRGAVKGVHRRCARRGAVMLEELDVTVMGRVSSAASKAVARAETDAEAAGERLDDLHRELLVAKAVDAELAAVNGERLRAGVDPFGEAERQWALRLVLG